MNALEIKDLNVYFGNKKILNNINLSLEGRGIYSIVGPNGGGKTTLIKTILNLINKESGEIKIFGQSNEKYLKENYVGYLPQNAQSFKKFPIKIIDIVLMGLIKEKGMIGFSKNKIDKAMRALKIVNIENLYNKLIYQVSGGQRQRAMIARAIVGEPKLLILDEPTTGLDVTSQKNFYEILKRLKEEMGMTIVMVTHDIGFVNSYTDRVICINQSIKAKNHNLECLSEPFSTKFYGYSIKMIEHNHSGDAK
jgi:zinc transport system ATP-binding protein